MVTYIRMPQKGLTEESAILSQWFVKKGDKVKEGDYLFSIETGKATFNVESEVSGTVLETIGNEGDEIAIKSIVCVIGEEGENYEIEENSEKAQPADELPESVKPKPAAEVKEETDAPLDWDIIRISPRARALAEKKGVDISLTVGSGPKGRIVEQDIRQLIESGAFVKHEETVEDIKSDSEEKEKAPHMEVVNEDEFEIVKNSSIRKAIAQNMHRSLQEMAQLTINSHFDATEILAYRQRIKDSMEKMNLSNITINDIIVFAVSRTLTDFPTLNAHYSDTEMKLYKNTHIGIAVDTKRGLMVPTLFNANKKSLNDISKEAKALALMCQDGAIEPEKLRGATFTISNLGSFRVDSFTPVINPPQVAILGVGSIEYKARMDKGEIVHYPAINLSLTIDHRAVDGAPAARFLKALAENLENFSLLLSK